MPGKSTLAYGNEVLDTLLYVPSVTYPTLAANASGSNTATIPGTLPGDMISMSMQSPPAHLSLDNAYVSVAGTVTLTWFTDGTGISSGTVGVIFNVVRFENLNVSGVTGMPNAIT